MSNINIKKKTISSFFKHIFQTHNNFVFNIIVLYLRIFLKDLIIIKLLKY